MAIHSISSCSFGTMQEYRQRLGMDRTYIGSGARFSTVHAAWPSGTMSVLLAPEAPETPN